MDKIRSFSKLSFITSAIILLVGYFPVIASAASAPSTTTAGTTCTDSSSANNPSGPGVRRPAGADADTYKYDCKTGLWSNGYYTFNPATGQITANFTQTYAYNDATDKYDTTTYIYDAPHDKYVPIVESVTTPPNGAIITKAKPLPSASAPATSQTVTTGAGNGSTNQQTTSLSNNLGDTSNTSATANNNSSSQATSGNATIFGNTTAGDATSGNTNDIANIINMLQSSSNAFGSGSNLVTFTSNINGDVNGDLLLDPAALSTMQPASNLTNVSNNVTVNTGTNAQMNNNITVGATSGNATVAANTKAGNATSGTANAVADVVNMLNSVVTAGQSFLGVVNINGNLNGDILLPQNFVNQLLTSNAPSTTLNISQNTNANTQVQNADTTNIGNAVSTNAKSGSANVNANTSAGNATTGTAKTNVTIFNLTGSQVIGSNDLLVFVNVLGKWVGMIVNAPAGTSAAELGGGVTSNTLSANTDINNTNTTGINNNVAVNAQSGDATVNQNTAAGNAKSGNATASANLLNMANSSLDLANWFGVLFINVFGSWNGSFGVNTSAGDPTTTKPSHQPVSSNGTSAVAKVFKFVPSGASQFSVTPLGSASGSSSATPTQQTKNSVLGSAATQSTPPAPKITTEAAQHNYLIPTAGFILAGLLLASEKLPFFRRTSATT